VPGPQTFGKEISPETSDSCANRMGLGRVSCPEMNACHLRAEFVAIHFISFELSWAEWQWQWRSGAHGGGDPSSVRLSWVLRDRKRNFNLARKRRHDAWLSMI